jgi:hypothetical protein
MSSSKAKNSPKGKLIFYDETKKYTNDGKLKSAEEMIVRHGEDGYYAKYFVRKGDKSTKIEVKSSASGGEYTLVVTENGDRKETKHTKTDLMAKLKKNPALGFMVDYIGKTKSLARARKARRSVKKAVRRSVKKAVRKKSRSKSKARRKVKRSKSKSKSKSRRRRKRSLKRATARKAGTKRKAKKSHSKKRRKSKTGSKRKKAVKRTRSKRRSRKR